MIVLKPKDSASVFVAAHPGLASTPLNATASPVPTPTLRAGIQSVEVGFVLLRTLGQAKAPLMLRDLAQAAQMSAAKAHRYLVSFQRLGLVVQDPATALYDLGPAALQLGLAALARLDGVKLARDRMAKFRARHGLTSAVAVWGNHGPTIVHWDDAPQSVTANLRLGDVMPLLTSATGRCFAAFMPPETVRGMLGVALQQGKLLQRDDVPGTDEALQTLLTSIRAQGFARITNTLLPGIAGIAAPVFDADGHLALAIVALGSVANFDAPQSPSTHPQRGDALAQALLDCARELSHELGWHAP